MSTPTLLPRTIRPIPLEIVPALRLLLRIFDYVEDAEVEPWQFAVEFYELKTNGLTRGDARWLISKGFVEHARETTIPGDRARSFRLLPPTALPDDACFILTEAGARHFRRSLVDLIPVSIPPRPAMPRDIPKNISPSISTEPHPDLSLPEWNEDRRELRFHGQLIKRYRVPAPNQQRILTAFTEDGWPEVIDDPLPPMPGQEPKRRLQATLKALNRHQVAALLRFHGNGDGCRVYWVEVGG